MRVAVIFLNYGRQDLSPETLRHNLSNSGYPFDFFCVSVKGIGEAINTGLRMAPGYDAYMTMANDILEPDNWLYWRVNAANHVPGAGLIGYPFDKARKHFDYTDVIGNLFFTKEVLEKVGAFNTSMGEYAPIDNDYNRRTIAAGFVNLYLPNAIAKHLRPNDDGIYGYSKSEKIKEVWPQHVQDANDYGTGNKDFHIPLIEMEQMNEDKSRHVKMTFPKQY